MARKLAARLEYGCLSTDDLGQAIGAATTAKSHPAFHEMDGIDYREYYVTHSLVELIADVERRHAALWPALARVITTHAAWGDPTVIEGWALYPARVAALRLPDYASLWLVADDAVLEARVRAAADFYRGASDEETMIRHFIERSRCYNERVREEAWRLEMPVISVTLETTVDEIVLAGAFDGRGG